MFKDIAGVVVAVAIGLTVPTAVVGDDDFPIVGVYAKDRTCKGDGSDPADSLVKITTMQIDSHMGSCAILSKSRNRKTISVQVECTVPGDQTLLGEVTFRLRDDNALDFDDQDHTSPAVLHKCGQ